MTRNGIWLSLGLGLLAFVLDRAFKYVQIDVLHWTTGSFTELLPIIDVGLVYNSGVSYGLLSWLPPWGLGLVVAVAFAALVVWWARSPSRLVRAALAICIGGAASNIVDRLLYGSVADSFWLHLGDYSFFIFNLADAAITAGVLLLALDLLGIGRPRHANAT
ncbi:MAG: signal peptidase II [Devosia sp.]